MSHEEYFELLKSARSHFSRRAKLCVIRPLDSDTFYIVKYSDYQRSSEGGNLRAYDPKSRKVRRFLLTEVEVVFGGDYNCSSKVENLNSCL